MPALAAGTSYTVVLTQPSGTNTAGGTFLSTGGFGGAAGGCAPTITSFTPTCARPDVVVTITGTNLLDASNLTGDEFRRGRVVPGHDRPGMTTATQPVPDLSSATSISAIVPTDIADGPILVETDVDANAATGGIQGVFSTTSFLTPPPDCVPVTGNEHARAITFKLKKSGSGQWGRQLDRGPRLHRLRGGRPRQDPAQDQGWWLEERGQPRPPTTRGRTSKKTKGKPGKYRALAPKVSLGDPVTDVCLKAKSATRKIE